MILVFGPTGNVGRAVVALLAAEGHPVRAFVRDPRRAAFAPDVEVVRGDLADRRSVAAATDGVDRAFLLSAGPAAVTHDGNVASALRAAGVRRVVKLSSIAARPPIDNSYGHAHAAGERYARAACPEWTILRPAAFMSNALQWVDAVRTTGTVHRPFGKIPRALIDPRDVAAVAVRALTADGHAGEVYELTGPAALTMSEQLDMLAAALGRPLTYVDLPVSAASAAMVRAGMEPPLVDGMLASQGDPDPARGGVPLPTVERIVGRPPRTFQAWLSEHIALFR
jgi:uncharacterized protein YbjT (DUF2867 family)